MATKFDLPLWHPVREVKGDEKGEGEQPEGRDKDNGSQEKKRLKKKRENNSLEGIKEANFFEDKQEEGRGRRWKLPAATLSLFLFFFYNRENVRSESAAISRRAEFVGERLSRRQQWRRGRAVRQCNRETWPMEQ